MNIIKTSNGKEFCFNQLIKSILNNEKCCLIVDSDVELALHLKKYHLFMNTFINRRLLSQSAQLLDYPNTFLLKDEITLTNKDNIFFGLIDIDIKNFDDITYEIFLNHQKNFVSLNNLSNYFYILDVKNTFMIYRGQNIGSLCVNNGLNLNPKNNAKDYNKSTPYMVPSHGISFISNVINNNVFNDFFSILKNILLEENVPFVENNGDLFINNKKFFGTSITNRNKNNINQSIFNSSLYTEFEPEKDFFFNKMKYTGSHIYTGISEEFPQFTKSNLIQKLYKLLTFYFYTKII